MSTAGLTPSPASFGNDASLDMNIISEYPSLYPTGSAELDLESILASTFAWNGHIGLGWDNPSVEDQTLSGTVKSEENPAGPEQETEEAETAKVPQTIAKPSPRRRRRKVASTSTDRKVGLSRHEQSLERNRLAASRCRQKKKEGTQRLETRFREQAQKKRQLEGDITGLRSELLGLKNEILKHALYDDGRVGRHLARMMQRITQGEPATGGASLSGLATANLPGDVSEASYADDGIGSDASYSSLGQS